ncbi:hypothetical protein [Nocardiopsis composta]|uniref:Deazaflavin-dependent oxidoreductase, nitroreductase family n=1 Tax=Nocardiopsis composta TaxID=157465 RepID=A0A7W8QQR3_9ACTN|nr:hypothetical protein [Nocardiopsis composta]MBB5434749.1 hypothetical protein [Nocardiopsis composta]
MSGERWDRRLFTAANRVVRPVLRSRLHPLFGGLMLVGYTGARTGREYEIPVSCHLRGPGEVWAFGARTGWVTNLRGGREVRLRIRGREFRAEGTAVEEPEEVGALLAELVREYGTRSLRGRALGLPWGREPTAEELAGAGGRTRIARFRVLADGG